MAIPTPTDIKLHQASHKLEIAFTDGARFELPFEFLRVYSPSAEVRGHGPGQEVLQVGKRDVLINAAEPVGLYGINFTFSDGHNTGIYSWEYLYELGVNQAALWDDVSEAHGSRRRLARPRHRQDVRAAPQGQVMTAMNVRPAFHDAPLGARFA